MKGETAAKTVALCNVVIVLKYFMTILFQGLRRTRAPEDGFQPPAIRDAAKAPAKPLSEPLTNNKKYQFSEEQRWQRIVLNDLENVLIGIVMMWLSLLVSGDPATTAVCAIAITAGRVAYTICYAYRLMPWRSLAWIIALLATLTLVGNIVYGVFKHPNRWN